MFGYTMRDLRDAAIAVAVGAALAVLIVVVFVEIVRP
jgi:hypothetical protein